ncbi:MAG: hypothetical protein IKW31_03980 [Alistipes sp.]|nr:hypothetical protein [Alistipes sp.]
MDVVITYVDGLDPLWQRDYEEHTNIPILEKRFRDWGTLRYLMRGVAVNMPFIRKVHLVVARDSQVPKWVNRNEVNVVLHKDIIPEKFLPTFNCNPIELHLHRIKDLDEQYVYFNDDVFPLKKCEPTDFFVDGKGQLGMSRHLLSIDMFKKICRNSDVMARRALGMKPSLFFLRPQHVCTPMIKSECEALYESVKDELHASITMTRTAKNVSQYVFLNYMYLNGTLQNNRLSKRHFSLGITSTEKLRKFIINPTKTFTCINDVQLSHERFEELRKVLIDAFETLLPNKSKYEI